MLKKDLDKLIEFRDQIKQHMPMMRAVREAGDVEVKYRQEQKDGTLDATKYTPKFLSRMAIADRIYALHEECGDWQNAQVVELLMLKDQLLREEVNERLNLQSKGEQEIQQEE